MASTIRRLEAVNKELWLVLSMFVIALALNLALDTQRMMLSFYTLPTLGSAYSARPSPRDADGVRQRPDCRHAHGDGGDFRQQNRPGTWPPPGST